MKKEYEKLNTRLKEQMQTDLNFDIVVKPLLVQGIHMSLYFVDGFAKDEILEKMMEFLLKADIKECVETQDIQTFCDSWLSYLEVDVQPDFAAMITSVLNMLARDTRKLILACMRLLLYLTPILWPISRLHKYGWQMTVRYIMKANPIYYIVCGYRDCFLYHHGILFYWKQMLFFWVFVIVIFTIGSMMMYKFKHKFIDMI